MYLTLFYVFWGIDWKYKVTSSYVIQRKTFSCVIYLRIGPKSPKCGLWESLGHFHYPNGPSDMLSSLRIPYARTCFEHLDQMLSNPHVQFASAR